MQLLDKIDLYSKLESRKTLSKKPLRISWVKKKGTPKSQEKCYSKWKPLSLFFCFSFRKNSDILVFCQHTIFYLFLLLAIHYSKFCVINLQIETFYLPSFIQEISRKSPKFQISCPQLANCMHTPNIFLYLTFICPDLKEINETHFISEESVPVQKLLEITQLLHFHKWPMRECRERDTSQPA